LSVRRNEPVPRGHALTIMVFDFPFQGPDLGELDRLLVSVVQV
jgi:hypothetical protein